MKNGDTLKVRTVSWATAGRDGHFDLRVDTKHLDHLRNVNAGGGISYEVVGWTADRQGTTYIAGTLDGDPASIEVSAKAHLVTPSAADEVKASAASAADDGANAAIPICVWVQKSTFDTWVAIGQTWPYGSDKGWMKSSTSHAFSVGAAASASGVYGDWESSGSTSAESGITFTWAESVAYREYREEHRYGKFQFVCAGKGGDWSSHELFGTGGYTTAASTNPGFTTHPVTVSAGLWERNRTDGSHFKLSAGVKAAGVLGINLSVDTNYSQVHELSYRLVAAGKIYGDTNVPSLAARVRTGR